jgi:beta-mannosidase
LLDFSGKVLTERTQDVQIPAQSSAVYFTLDQKELLADANPRNSFLVFDLSVAGQPVSRNLLFFDTMHNLDLTRSVKIEASVEGSNGAYTVTLRSPLWGAAFTYRSMTWTCKLPTIISIYCRVSL